MYFGPSLQHALITIATIILQRNSELEELGLRQEFDEEYDFIIIGGGTAGSVIAGRLSEVSKVTVLVLERGGTENLVTDMPALDFMNLMPNETMPRLTHEHYIEPQVSGQFGFPNNSINWMAHHVLGGGSTMNGMLYNRGGRWDYDGWAKDFGAEGWDFENVLPYFRKSEDNKDPDYFEGDFAKFHSTGGPLTVETPDLKENTAAYRLLAETMTDGAVELGYNITDLNGGQQIGVAIPQRTTRNGRRLSTSQAFLYPARDRWNLHILTKALVTKIDFNDQKRAVSVQFSYKDKPQSVRARKEIILSAGTINSAKLLLLSGIGPQEDLEPLGIQCISDLRVGHNVQDHTRVGGVDYTVNTSLWESWDTFYTIENLEKFYTKGKGPLANTFYLQQGAIINLRTTVDPDGKTYGPSDLFLAPFMLWPGRPGLVLSSEKIALEKSIVDEYYGPYKKGHSLNILMILNYARSRGRIWLRSNNSDDDPFIDPKYLSDPYDVERLIEAYKIGFALGETNAFKSLGAKPYESIMPYCKSFVPVTSDAYIQCVIRTMAASEQHFSGSCKMAAKDDPTAVVDPRLRVLGVKSLRVADASIMPQIITGNLMAGAIMIGEKAADMIKQDNNLPCDPLPK